MKGILVVVLVIAAIPAMPQGSVCPHPIVETGTLREVIASIEGYDTTATTNQARFVADFLFALARHPQAGGSHRSFQIQPERYFEAWVQATGNPPRSAPVSMRRVAEHDQRIVVAIQPDLHIDGPANQKPELVLAVRAGWSESSGKPDHYEYEDTKSDPNVRIRHQRDIRYVLIKFDDFIAYERVEGVSGKPTSGGLGALFSLLGMAEMQSSRLAIAGDGTQVNRTRVAKLFTFNAVARVAPNGDASRRIPDDRADLARLAASMDVDLDVRPPDRWPKICF